MGSGGNDGVGPAVKKGRGRPRTEWNFLSNHGHVLVCIAMDSDTRLRDIATRVGITERAVFGIVEDLERGGIIERLRVGRRNRYIVNVDQPLRHDLISEHTVGDLLGVFAFSGAELDKLRAEVPAEQN